MSLNRSFIKEFDMKKISIRKMQNLKTTAIAAYPIWECWPF